MINLGLAEEVVLQLTNLWENNFALFKVTSFSIAELWLRCSLKRILMLLGLEDQTESKC